MYRASGVEPPASPVAAAHSAEPGGAELPMTSRGPAPADINPISGATGQADLGVDVPLTGVHLAADRAGRRPASGGRSSSEPFHPVASRVCRTWMALAKWPARQGRQRSLRRMSQVLSWALVHSPVRGRERSPTRVKRWQTARPVRVRRQGLEPRTRGLRVRCSAS